MAISALIAIGLPVGLFLVWRKRFNLKLVPVLVGAGMFFVFVLVLEQLLHMVVLQPAADGSIALRQNAPLLYVLYGILAAGLFEETARLIAFTLLKRKYKGVGTGLSYGIGHGGFEAIVLVGLSMISNIVLSMVINSGSAATLGDLPEVKTAIDALVGTDSYLFLIAGIERIAAIAAQISLSILVWLAVSTRKFWLYPIAIGLHAIIDLPAVLAQIGVINSPLIVEVATFVLVAGLVVIALRAYKALGTRTAVAYPPPA
jgi:uncharacterized membrane protein YhfC